MHNGLPPQKFIIQDNWLRIGRVDLHKQLARGTVKPVVGGGWWYFDKPNHTMYLYSKSEDFGAVTQQQIDDAYFLERDDREVKVVFEPNIYTLKDLFEKYNLQQW